MLSDVRPLPDCFCPLLLALTDKATPTMLPSSPPRLTRNTITENLTNQDENSETDQSELSACSITSGHVEQSIFQTADPNSL